MLWKLGIQFINIFRLTEEESGVFGKYLPNYHFELLNLNSENLDSLNLTLFEMTLFKIMQHIDRNDLEENLYDIFNLSFTYFVEQKKLEKLRKLLLYIFTRGDISVEQIKTTFDAISNELEKEAMTTAEKLIEQGIEQGIEKGIKEAHLQDAQAMLAEGIPLDTVLKITTLPLDDLFKAGIIRCKFLNSLMT